MKNLSTNFIACCVGGLFCFAISQVVSAQSTQFPYRATVIGNDSIVRSGPGSTYYGTDRLRPGTEVTVYSHDPDGWVAIRPPERSFSLIQRDEIEIYQNGLAKVTEEETVAWVGTRLSAVKKPLWQVKLRKGEMLEVLGIVDRQQYKLDRKEPDWVQIQPPKGEFRWVAASDIRAEVTTAAPNVPRELDDNDINEFKIDSTNNAQSQNSHSQNARFGNEQNGVERSGGNGPKPFDSWEPSQNPGQWTLEVESGEMNSGESFGSSTSNDFGATSIPPADHGWKPARQTIANFTNERSGFLAESSPNNMYTNQWNDSPSSTTATANPSMSNVSARSNIFDATDTVGSSHAQSSGSLSAPTLLTPNFGSAPTTTNAELLSLEMKLTQEMIKPPSNWDLTSMATEAERLRNSTSSAQDQEFINRLMEKIRNCRQIKAGYRATGSGASDDLQTRYNNKEAPGLSGSRGNAGTSQANLLYDYDAHGFLNELVRDGGSGPTTYVLQDANGRITHHIAAPPGVNLRRYLNQRVGIIGNRGYHQQLKLDHVTAERVISIESLRR